MKLDNIPQELQSSIEKKGYKKLTNVQKLVLNNDLKGQDLLVSLQTGSGKTLAYGLSVLLVIKKDLIGPSWIMVWRTPLPPLISI